MAHIVNLIANRIIFALTDRDLTTFEENEDTDEGEISDSDIEEKFFEMYCETVKAVFGIVSKVRNSPKLMDSLKTHQETDGRVPRVLEKPNATKWNSVLDMLNRFSFLRYYLVAMFPNELANFSWDKLAKLVSVLALLKEVTMELQKSEADANTIVSVISYLRDLSHNESDIYRPISDVFLKHLDKNTVVIGLLDNAGPFYNFVRTKVLAARENRTSHLLQDVQVKCEQLAS